MWLKLQIPLLAACLSLSPTLVQAQQNEPQTAKERALKTENIHELEDLFAHFAQLQDEAACMAILEHFDTLALRELRKVANVEEKARRMDVTGYIVTQMMKAYHQSKLSSETVRDRLDELIRHYPRREE